MAYSHIPTQPPAPHIALWMLRILTSPQVLHNFVHKDGFANDRLAYALGMNDWIDPDDCTFSAPLVRKALYQRLAQARCEWARSPPPAVLQGNVDRLAELVGLDALEARILTFVACMDTEPLLSDATVLLKSNTSTHVVEIVALVLDAPVARVRPALGSDGLLARSGLVQVNRDGSSGFRGKLELMSDTFADQMVSTDSDPIELLRGRVQPAARGHLRLTDYGHIQSTLDIVQPWLRHAQGTARRGVNIYLHGAPGTGKTELARALAHDIGFELFEVASESEYGQPINGIDRVRAFCAAQKFLEQRKALLLFDEVEDVFTDRPLDRDKSAPSHKAWLNRLLEDNPVPTLWLSNEVRGLDAAFIRRFDMVFELPVPPRSQRERIVGAYCGDLLDAPRLTRVAAAPHLAPAVVARASAVAHAILPERGRAASAHAFEQLVSQTLQAQGHRPLPRHDANRLPEVYDPVFLNADTDLAELAQGLTAARDTGGARLCLYGPPGTGKTAFGRWLAERLDMTLQVERASDLLSPYVGEAEKNIARAFRQAEDDGALLLIDEVDSFLQDRRGAQRSWEVTQVNEMLTQMEGFAGVFIASTNLMDGLDPAALRRFDLKVKLDYLRAPQAWALLQRHCAQLGLPAPGAAEQARLTQLKQLTPGDLAAVLRQSRFMPFASAAAVVYALEGECGLKKDGRQAIGFFEPKMGTSSDGISAISYQK